MISKISRRLIVVIFVVVTVMFIYLNLAHNNPYVSNNDGGKFGLMFACLVLLYIVIRKKIKRRELLVLSTISKLILFIYVLKIGVINTFIYVPLIMLSAIILERIIFNISKNDNLSTIGMTFFVLLPNIITENYFKTIIINLFTLLLIYYSIKIIDEIKQYNLKNKKYIFLSIIVGIILGFLTVFGVTPILICALTILFIFITSNIDSVNIRLFGSLYKTSNIKKKDFFYKIERIRINKTFICSLIIFLVSYLIYYLYVVVLRNNYELILDFNFLKTNIVNMVSLSDTFYMSINIYILLIELLTFWLRRRYDTKTTYIKIIFLVLLLTVHNIYAYEYVISTLLVIIAVINTSNIYLNREEKVKLLESSKG